MTDSVHSDWRLAQIEALESKIREINDENIQFRKALEHVAATDTTVDEHGIWLIDGKTFQKWAADVLKGNENCDGLNGENE